MEKLISQEGWTTNHPHPKDVVQKWMPPTKAQVESDPEIIRRVTRQKWSGLALKDFGGKGQGTYKCFITQSNVTNKSNHTVDKHINILSF